MNATEQFLAVNAHVDAAAVQPLPNSRKVYIEGSRPDIRVPMREISQDDTPTAFGGEKNPPVYVYDCSGPYSDPAAKIDIRSGLPALRAQWIAERGDVEELAGLTSDFGRQRAADAKLDELRFPGLHRKPLRAKAGKNVSQMHYARQDIITPEMEYVAIRENNNRRAYMESLRSNRQNGRKNGCPARSPAPGPEFRRQHSRGNHPGIRAQRNRPRPRHHPQQHQPPGKRADDHRPQFPGQDQRQYRQLGLRFLAFRKKSRK